MSNNTVLSRKLDKTWKLGFSRIALHSSSTQFGKWDLEIRWLVYDLNESGRLLWTNLLFIIFQLHSFLPHQKLFFLDFKKHFNVIVHISWWNQRDLQQSKCQNKWSNFQCKVLHKDHEISSMVTQQKFTEGRKTENFLYLV